MNRTRRLITASVATFGALVLSGGVIAAPKEKKEKKEKHHHANGKQLLGEKIKTNGRHEIEKKGAHTVSVETKGGKIAGLQVKHAKKGELPVKKYKTEKKMAQTYGFRYASLQLAQAQSLGIIYIGYAYYDDYGDEVIYWFPYEMILDGETGAVDYIPIY